MWLWSFWPPFLGTGIQVEKIEGGTGRQGWKAIDVRLKLRFWNSNYVGTQFGGSLYAMTDPFFMLILMRRLGKDFVVWDQVSKIEFKRPGTTDCRVRFEVSDGEIERIRQETIAHGKMNWVRTVEIRDTNERVVALVEKTLYIATKEFYENKR